MTVKAQIFIIQEEQLVVLTAFFLALPLPPLMSRDGKSTDASTEATLKQATRSLEEKGWITTDPSQAQPAVVLPELAEVLRDMAYGNQMLHLYYQHRGEAARQIAFYRNQERVIRQELTGDGWHMIGRVDGDMGKGLAETFLRGAPEGKPGAKVSVPLEAWHYLLSSRVAGIAEKVLAESISAGEPAVPEESGERRRFAQDVLRANFVLEITSVADRLAGTSEKVAFVAAGETDWLVIPSMPLAGQESLWALEVNRHSFFQALAGLFAPLHPDAVAERRAE